MTPNERKARTEAFLRERGIPYLSSLPCVESEEETELRSAEEIGVRMICLFCVIGSAYDFSDKSYVQYLMKHQLWNHLSPEEVSFLSDPAPSPQTRRSFTWRCEALFVLMWAVRLFDELPFPTRQTDNEAIISKFPSFGDSPWPFIHSLKLRSTAEILDASDLIYRLHWAVTQAELDEERPPAGLDSEVVFEWHHAINWLTKYDNLDWDDVTVDT